MSSAPERDTIAAIATPPGRGGIGILRLSGPDALALAAPMLRLRAPLEPNRARFCEIVEPSGSIAADPAPPAPKLDEAIATWYAAPHSYTGEHVLEIAAHGSPVLLDFLLRQVTAHGARLADPGEFTERAFLAGRLDLTQAEAVRDLIDAQTLYQARVAASQLDGALSRRIAPIKTALIHLIAQLEAGIDFAEDDTPTLSAAAIAALAAPIADDLSALARSFDHGRLVHAGLTLAIVGEPNVGKSSLFNRLVERERAIVTSTPGTTRDLVTERISIAGIPVELVDTAGLREASDEAEKLGIKKSREALAEADLVLIVLDATHLPGSAPPDRPTAPVAALPQLDQPADRTQPAEPLTSAADLLRDHLQKSSTAPRLGLLQERAPIFVLNKCDLLPPAFAAHLASELGHGAAASPGGDTSHSQPGWLQIGKQPQQQAFCVLTSAHTGEGIAVLRSALADRLRTPAMGEQSGLVTNLRQHQAVESARSSLASSIAAAQSAIPHEMLLLDLYATLHQLDTLTGATTPDDILNLVFSTFCIGK